MIADCTADVNIIRRLADEPSLSADELKYAFDEAGQNIKNWINDEFIPSLTEELKAKQDLIDIVPNSTLSVDENGNIVAVTVNMNEISTLEGVTANVQEQIDELKQKMQSVITCGLEAPSGGSNGDIYIQYVQEV